MNVNIYLADLVIRQQKGRGRRCTYHIFIKEMKHPISLRLATITRANFTDSLRFLRRKEETVVAMEGDVRFREIACYAHAQLYFLFKSVNQRYMFVVKLDLEKRAVTITSYEWSDRQQQYVPLRTNALLMIERQLIYDILQSLSICTKKQVSYLCMSPARKNKRDI
ncbi:hypothetical protein [Anoxybacillus sp. J5B_2022]|uniref:hypothetical protein n=1 Tax=Anoxybacillus sp. J5B_2022 TaxID=3003246 RepID=UPI00228635E8|nr:hypothetical protein [Anoxybacillus sp. J5B_2022]MCZ0753958.1 hypothetical protein [Anoxybacillus sp. J5B_2022]